MKNKTYLQKISIIYAIIAIILLGLSTISLFFNEWVLILCVLVCSIFGYLSLFLFYKQSKTAVNNTGIYTLLRYFFMAVGLAISALLIKLTMGQYAESKRYIMLVIGAIPYFVPTIVLLVVSGDKNDK